jgi:hypothetical protein
MAGVGATSAYATDIIAVQRVYYSQVFNFSCLSISFFTVHLLTATQ